MFVVAAVFIIGGLTCWLLGALLEACARRRERAWRQREEAWRRVVMAAHAASLAAPEEVDTLIYWRDHEGNVHSGRTLMRHSDAERVVRLLNSAGERARFSDRPSPVTTWWCERVAPLEAYGLEHA